MKRAYGYFSPILFFCILNPFTAENSFSFDVRTQYIISGDSSTKLSYSFAKKKDSGQSFNSLYNLDYEADKGTSEVSHVITGNDTSTNFKINYESGSGGFIRYLETMSRSVQSQYPYTFPFNNSSNKFHTFGRGRSFFSGNVLSLMSQYSPKRGTLNLDAFGKGNFGVMIGKSAKSGTIAEKANFNLEMDGEFTIEGSYDFFDESSIKILGNGFSGGP